MVILFETEDWRRKTEGNYFNKLYNNSYPTTVSISFLVN